jgi:hypothetical protein
VAIETSEGTRETMWFYELVALTVLLVIGRTYMNPDPKHTKTEQILSLVNNIGIES